MRVTATSGACSTRTTRTRSQSRVHRNGPMVALATRTGFVFDTMVWPSAAPTGTPSNVGGYSGWPDQRTRTARRRSLAKAWTAGLLRTDPAAIGHLARG